MDKLICDECSADGPRGLTMMIGECARCHGPMSSSSYTYCRPCAKQLQACIFCAAGLKRTIKDELPGFRMVPVNQVEAEALAVLAKEMDVPEERVFIQALRFYQLCRARGYDKWVEKKEMELVQPPGCPDLS